jgi:hypothetical protein
VCVFDGTYYKNTTTNYISKTSLYTTCHSVELLVVVEGPPKLPKHYHAVQWVHACVLVCLQALCGEYMLGLLLILISKSWRCLMLVWTPCLMHMCVCIWRYVLQNYNCKLHFQNLSILPHFTCIHWDSNCWKSWCLQCLWPVR